MGPGPDSDCGLCSEGTVYPGLAVMRRLLILFALGEVVAAREGDQDDGGQHDGLPDFLPHGTKLRSRSLIHMTHQRCRQYYLTG